MPESSTTQYQMSNVTPGFLPAVHSRTRWYWLRGKKTRKCSWLGYAPQLRSGTCLPSTQAYRPEHLRKIKRDTSNCKRENLQHSDVGHTCAHNFLHRLQKLFYGLSNDPKKINSLLVNNYYFNHYIILVLFKIYWILWLNLTSFIKCLCACVWQRVINVRGT